MIKKVASQQETLQSIIDVAEIHAKRLKYAMKKLSSYFPISPEVIVALSDDELPLFELYTSRFSKLQDLIGNALFPKLLASVGEPVDEMTFIDRLNRLEKLGVLDNAENWMKLRQIRNHLSHEYPDQPEITAEYLNDAFDFGRILLKCLEKSIQFATR